MRKPRYLVESYTDDYKSLFQAIMIDLKLDKESGGKHSNWMRASINPNLKHLVREQYFTKNMKLIKENRYEL